ncbi:MAG: hypothetical protein ACJ763_14705 [Bdellovibrionia bacterium]
MKNNALWYLSPIAFALLSATWISHADLNNGAYAQTNAVRTIQSTSTTPNAHCVHEFNENVTTAVHPMRMADAVQCAR